MLNSFPFIFIQNNFIKYLDDLLFSVIKKKFILTKKYYQNRFLVMVPIYFFQNKNRKLFKYLQNIQFDVKF